MLSKLLKYIQNNLKKLLFLNILLLVILYVILILPLRIYFDIPLTGMNLGGINEGVIIKMFSKGDEKVFLSSLNGITKENDFIDFGESVRIGIVMVKGRKEDNYTRNYGFITFNGKFKNKNSKFELLKYLGVTDNQIEEYIMNDIKVYDVATDVANCTIIDSEDKNNVEINIKKTIPEDYLTHSINPGKNLRDLDEQTTMLGYVLTVNEITSKNVFLKSLKILLIEFIVIIFINIIYYENQRKKV